MAGLSLLVPWVSFSDRIRTAYPTTPIYPKFPHKQSTLRLTTSTVSVQVMPRTVSEFDFERFLYE